MLKDSDIVSYTARRTHQTYTWCGGLVCGDFSGQQQLKVRGATEVG